MADVFLLSPLVSILIKIDKQYIYWHKNKPQQKIAEVFNTAYVTAGTPKEYLRH